MTKFSPDDDPDPEELVFTVPTAYDADDLAAGLVKLPPCRLLLTVVLDLFLTWDYDLVWEAADYLFTGLFLTWLV